MTFIMHETHRTSPLLPLNFSVMYDMVEVKPKALLNDCKSIQIPHKYSNTCVYVCVYPCRAESVTHLLCKHKHIIMKYHFTSSVGFLFIGCRPMACLPVTTECQWSYCTLKKIMVLQRFFAVVLYSTHCRRKNLWKPVWFFSGSLKWWRCYMAPCHTKNQWSPCMDL